MIKEYRTKFNNAFSEEAYQTFLTDLNSYLDIPVKFRVAESPVFVPKYLKERLFEACNDIIAFVKRPDFKELTESTLNEQTRVPNEDAHTLFLCIDFAVTLDKEGNLFPQLIEFQGFPSLFCYKNLLQKKYKEHFPIPENLSPFFSGLNEETYIERFKKAILNGHSPENVILLEIEPLKQNTAIDFVATKHYLGIEPVCISELLKENGKLYYFKNGVKTEVKRIYNRIIFDELLQRPDLKRQFNMIDDDVTVEWAGHPNWYSRISKFCMPHLKSKYVPESRLLSSFESFPSDLENYVLKPLYSFSGSGVKFHVTAEDLAAVPKESYNDWMLQKKVTYEPVIEAADEGKVKLEIRMLYLWEAGNENPEPVINISRMSRGEMIGVKYNMNKTWVGGGICFFE